MARRATAFEYLWEAVLPKRLAPRRMAPGVRVSDAQALLRAKARPTGGDGRWLTCIPAVVPFQRPHLLRNLAAKLIYALMSLLAQVYAARWFLFTALVALYAADKYQKYMRLRAFRGPFSTGWSEIWHTRVILNKTSHLAYKEVNDRYGE